jgi:HEAT repeat protein
MMMSAHGYPSKIGNYLINMTRLAVMLLPTLLLVGAAGRYYDNPNWMLWIGTFFQLTVCILSFFSSGSWRQPLGPSVITLYLIALAWLWFGDSKDDWYAHLTRAVLLIVPLLVFGFHTLAESGVPRMRRANILAQRLAHRKEWPSDLAACRALPEVKAFRAALGHDASPALSLLQHPLMEVRIAALTALEFRKEWRPGQAELVLQVAQRAEQPTLRATAVTALANLEDRPLVEMLAQFLHDASREVRKAATEALLWDTERRWSWIRFAVRRILADPLYQGDGPLTHDGQMLTREAVHDLTAWCAEKGVLASRSAMTLAAHYSRALSERPDPELVNALRQQLADPHTPAVLRLELGKLLQEFQELDAALLQKLLDPSNPAPLRLIACETVLAEQVEDKARAGAVVALRDLARLPNREIALATADVIQRRLGVDMGLGLGQPLPPLQSRQAADITRRVMHWATQYDVQEDEEVEDSRVIR